MLYAFCCTEFHLGSLEMGNFAGLHKSVDMWDGRLVHICFMFF